MASDAPLPSIATTCGCSLSNLLQRAIDLIDPGRASPADNDDGRTAATVVSVVVHPASNEIIDGSIREERDNTKDEDGGQATTLSSTAATTPPTKQEHVEKKKVLFSSSCAPPKKLICASDAILAYKILMHAASFSSSSPPVISDDNLNIHVSDYQCMNDINPYTSWDILSIMADIYRALIVTSNLLLELLPAKDYTDNLTRSKDDDTFSNAQKDIISSLTNNTKQKCPLQQCCSMDNTPSDYIPSLSSTIHKDILSTSRRSILLLQCLERICAVKAISQRHDNNPSQSNNDYLIPLHPALAHKGGDDIHDYDRSISDLMHNYDWHDDGFLPLPFAHTHTSDDIVGNGEEKEKDGDNQKNQQSNNQLPPSNILHECCYRPQYPNDPPSSQFEMIAWTRDWNFGERIVSLCLDDYQYFDVDDYDDGSDDSQQQDDPRNVQTNDDDSSEMLNADESDIKEEETISLNISPAEFEEEEGCLIDIMLAGQSPSTLRCDSDKSSKKKKKQKRLNAKERKKRKRQKKRHVQQLEQQEHAHQNIGQHIQAKEGFLLIVLSDDKSNSIFQHIHDSTKTIRVYARLHPSGLLSIEDCSVRWVNENKSMQQPQEPLPSRVRYYDFFITKRTKCQPCIPEGASSQLFHFQLYNIHFLGASTICQSKTIITPHENGVDLLFSIDEGSGGDFIDGFDWVNEFSSLSG